MRSVFITQELSPYFSAGGLGLFSASLPTTLASKFGIEHVIVLPFYPKLVEQRNIQTKVILELSPATLGSQTTSATICRVINEHPSCEILLVRSDAWYGYEDGIYGGGDKNAALRAVHFGLRIAQWIEQSNSEVDIVHGCDWQSGPALFFIDRLRRAKNGRMPRLLFNLQNATYRGNVKPEDLMGFGLTDEELEILRRIAPSKPSLMLMGMLAADKLVTASPTYAGEIVTKFAGTSFREPVQQKGITGIIWGVDTADWNPARQLEFNVPYTPDDLEEGKRQNKRLLQSHYQLKLEAQLPVFGICSRLVPEKGIDLIIEGLSTLIRSGQIQLVVLGYGNRRYCQTFERWAAEQPSLVAFEQNYSQSLAFLLFAACDFVFVPSLMEPSGTTQQIGMYFGTLPIVTPVGGLKDTVMDLRRDPGQGTGFMLDIPTASQLQSVTQQVLDWYHEYPDAFAQARRRAMTINQGTNRSGAEAYVEMYRRMMEKGSPP